MLRAETGCYVAENEHAKINRCVDDTCSSRSRRLQLNRAIVPRQLAAIPSHAGTAGLRSTGVVILDKLLVYPMAAVVAPPDFSIEQPTGDRTPWHDYRPEVPDFRPGGPETSFSTGKLSSLRAIISRPAVSLPTPGWGQYPL